MSPRVALALASVFLAAPPHAAMAKRPPPDVVEAAPAESALSAAIAPGGDPVRLVTVIGGKRPVATLQIGKAKPVTLAAGDAVGTVESAHGIVVTALAVTDAKQPFRIFIGGDGKATSIGRPVQRFDLPFSIALTPTPDGFTAFFQEVETQNTNEAHTYMQRLDKTGALVGELREVSVPWWLGDAVWNGTGYHLALFYSGDPSGMRLSMVSTDAAGQPQGHPDWASPPGMLSDVHLVASGKQILAYYRNLDRLVVSDVTKIGNWGQQAKAGRDLGALGTAAIAIDSKNQVTRVKPATAR